MKTPWWIPLTTSHKHEFEKQSEEIKKKFKQVASNKDDADITHSEQLVINLVQLPLYHTIPEYSAFKILVQITTAQQRRIPPENIKCYKLGTTTIMWHGAIWEYLGQAINIFCNRLLPLKKVSFDSVTNNSTLTHLSRSEIKPVEKEDLLATIDSLRDLNESIQHVLHLRNVAVHRHQLPNYLSRYICDEELEKKDEPDRIWRFEGLLEESFDTLLKALQKMNGFVTTENMKKWKPH